MPSPAPTSALATTTAISTRTWQADLKALCEQAKDRFPDVVWELFPDEESDIPEEVWGHKAMVYARAPPSFQARYFNFRPAPVASPNPYSTSPGIPIQSNYSLSLPGDGPPSPSRSPSPSPFQTPRAYSPSQISVTPGPLLRLSTAISPALFYNELEYLYTGQGGAAFEFLFDSSEVKSEGDDEENRVDKLRKDLVFMWRSRLYSDVRISLTSMSAPSSAEQTAAVFSSHRFILVSRSHYFRTLLLSNTFAPIAPSTNDPITISLPSPPFTPASLHFTLGYIYTGTLYFSHRTFDLTTAFHIHRSATYLSLDSLQAEIEARIVEEMMHGLFHAFLTFEDYEKVTGGRWGVGGCRCKQCARRAPRVLQFAMSDDVKNPILERGARRALVGLFGEGWVLSEFANLPPKARSAALKGVQMRTTPQNLFPLLFAAHTALAKLEQPNVINEPWTETIRDMVLVERKKIDEVFCVKCEEVFEQEEWLAIIERDGVGFDDMDKLCWAMASLKRGLSDKTAGIVYQTLVSSVLLRPHPTDGSTLLSSMSLVRKQIEATRKGIIEWLQKNWVSVQMANGFETLEGWAIKEISDELEVPVDDLLTPFASTRKGPATRSGLHSTLSAPKADTESEVASITSLRASVLNRNAAKGTRSRTSSTTADQKKEQTPLRSAAASVAHSVRSTAETSSPFQSPPVSSAPLPVIPRATSATPTQPRPKALVMSTSRESMSSENSSRQAVPAINPPSRSPTPTPATVETPKSKQNASTSSGRRVAASNTPSPNANNTRPKSIAPSVTSVRSTTAAVRKTSNTLAPVPAVARPLSRTSDASTSARPTQASLSPAAPRTRRVSTASTVSTTSTKGAASAAALAVPGPQSQPRTRTLSSTSATSSTSAAARRSLAKSPVPPAVPKKVTPAEPARPTNGQAATKRPVSTASVRSTISTTSTIGEKRKLSATQPKTEPLPDLPKVSTPPEVLEAQRPEPPPKSPTIPSPTRTLTSEGTATVRGLPQNGAHRRASTDTITTSSVGDATVRGVPRLAESTISSPAGSVVGAGGARGVTLNVGIACMISSKRSRFKAFARYIGEVEGERGPWVGVEVPIGEWGADKLEGRDWNDGSWRGIRYFEIGSPTDDGDGRAARRRRLDDLFGASSSILPSSGKKREGDTLSIDQDRMKRIRSASPAASDVSILETRGLFVRPQQILLVIGAQDTD